MRIDWFKSNKWYMYVWLESIVWLESEWSISKSISLESSWYIYFFQHVHIGNSVWFRVRDRLRVEVNHHIHCAVGFELHRDQ